MSMRMKWQTRKLTWEWLRVLGAMSSAEIQYVAQCSHPQALRIMQQLCNIKLAEYTLEGKTVCIKVNRKP